MCYMTYDHYNVTPMVLTLCTLWQTGCRCGAWVDVKHRCGAIARWCCQCSGSHPVSVEIAHAQWGPPVHPLHALRDSS